MLSSDAVEARSSASAGRDRQSIRFERVETHDPCVVRQARAPRLVETEIERLQQRGRLLRPAASESIVGLQDGLHERLHTGHVSTRRARRSPTRAPMTRDRCTTC